MNDSNPQSDKLLKTLEKEYEILRFKSFNAEAALAVGLDLVERVRRLKSKPATVDVFAAGRQVFHFAMDGTSPDNDEWIRRKRNSVLRFNKSSLHMGSLLASQGKTLEERYGVDRSDFATSGGGFPIIIADLGVVGAVVCSGLSQEEDHRLVVAALAARLGVDYISPV